MVNIEDFEFELVSGKALWGVICGTYVLPSDEVVGAELQLAVEHLRLGLSAYADPSGDHYEKWEKTAPVSKAEKAFVKKLSALLKLSATHSWQIFQLFLLNEYRGADASLSEVLASQRDEETFLGQLWNFYLADRLHLIRCLRHVVANTANPQHPYQSLFHDFMQDVLDKDGTLGESLVKQVMLCTKMVPPTPQSHGPHLPPHGPTTWLAHHLAELREVLATLLVYYGSTSQSPTPETFLKLVQLAQGGGLGGRPEIQEGIRESHAPLVEALDGAHVLLLTLIINADSPISDNKLCDSAWVKKLDPTMAGLGARTPHLAPLLAWAVLQLRASDGGAKGNPRMYNKLAQRAVHGNVFAYLQTALNNTSIQGDELLVRLASSVVYSLMCAAAGCLDLERMGCLSVLNTLAKRCLAQDPPAQLFWAEEGGGAGLLLPQAIEVFPYDVQPLLSLMSALAVANTESCQKVIELLTELPNLSWVLTQSDLRSIQIRGNDCVTTAPLQVLPSLTIAADTRGTLISTNPPVVTWQTPTNAWQALLGVMKLLDEEVSGGASIPDQKLMETVSATLRLLASLLTTLPDHLPAFVHFIQQTIVLLRRISQVSRPPGQLVATLMEFLTEVSTQDPKLVWNELESCPLLPFLAAPHKYGAKKGKVDPFLGYRAGALRALVCGEEAATGKYPILNSYTRLLICGVKDGFSSGSVNGGVVFVAREVTGALLRWCYSSQEERDTVLNHCLALLHHTLEASDIDSSVRDLVVKQLVDSSSAGQTLLSVVVGGANLETAINHPMHSPISTHAHRLTRTAQMALSILHRLVGEDTSMDGLNQLLRAAPTPNTPLSGGRLHGSTSPHLALTVALYAHQRLNPRLSYLALRTLTRFAQKLNVPLVACLGGEAEGIRDALLRRLDSATEDVRVKVALLRLLTASTTRQQGLTNAFLTPPEKLLDPLTSLFNPSTSTSSGRELGLAVVELVDALWSEKYTTATTYLQDKSDFWQALVQPLTKEKTNEVNNAIVGHTLRVLARQVFSSDAKPSACLKSAMDKLCDPVKGTICHWSEHIVNSLEDSGPLSNDVTELLLPAWRDLVVVMVARAKSWLADKQKVSIASDILHALLNQLEKESMDEKLALLLAELYLALVKHCGKNLIEKEDCFKGVGRLLVKVQEAVMTTPTHSQMLILGAALRMVKLTEPSAQSQGQALALLGPVTWLVQQHGRLAGSSSSSSSSSASSCTTAATLSLAAALLHQCLLRCAPDGARPFLAHTPVVPALLHAVETYMQCGEEEVVGELLRLLSTLSRVAELSDDLSTQTLSSTLTLTIPPSKTGLLSEVVWGVVWGVRREGVGGVEGGVNVAAVHLGALCGALGAPHRQPALALASAALVSVLAPYASMWIVTHPASYSQLTAATTRCIHITTQLLHTPRVVEMELSGGRSSSSSGGSAEAPAIAPQITAATTDVLNGMLQVVCACLSALIALGPDLTDLLCGPGIDVGAWTLFFHPSFRPVTALDPNAQPSLASLTSVLDLYDSHASKESRGLSPCRGGAPEVGLCIQVLAASAEKALLLLLTQATLALMRPETPPRDSLRVRHGLADEMNSFFTRWLGRRPAASPLPSSSSTASGTSCTAQVDLTYLRLAQQLVARLASNK